VKAGEWIILGTAIFCAMLTIGLIFIIPYIS